jgi:hypothetical protein
VLLVAWSFLGWGHLVLAATLFNAVGEGPGAACERLLPAPGASLWTWLNDLAAVLAVAFWAVAATGSLWARRQRRQKPR